MCQACVPELSAKPEVDAAQPDSIAVASHELSLPLSSVPLWAFSL